MQALTFNIRTFLTCLFLLIFFTTQGQNVNTVALKEFIRDASGTKLSNTEIGDKYFCTNIYHLNDKYGEEARSYLEFTLSNQRQYLREKNLVVNNISFKPFSQLFEDEMPPKPFHMLHETSNVYASVYQGKVLLFFLLNENRIASTLLIGQGDEHYFVDLCH
jgi:ATP-dependent Zn protease